MGAIVALLVLLQACTQKPGWKLVGTLPKDASCFTQGLEVHESIIYESCGQYGQSQVRSVDLASGAVIRFRNLESNYFMEGLTLHRGFVVGFTWHEGTAFQWRRNDFHLLRTWSYAGEGWGICDTDLGFWTSDGSSNLLRRSHDTFQVLQTLKITEQGKPVPLLNELECLGDNRVLANVWRSNSIVAIDTQTGRVIRQWDFTDLVKQEAATSAEAVFNGVARLPNSQSTRDHFLVTGKYWRNYYRVEMSW